MTITPFANTLTLRAYRRRGVNVCVRVILLTLFIVTLSSCIPSSREVVRIGTSVWPGYEPLFIAREKNWIDSGHVHLVEYSSATEVIRAFRNHSIDAATLTLDEVLLLAETGDEPRIVLVLDTSDSAGSLIVPPTIATLPELKDKRIGVENTALGAFLLHQMLVYSGLSIDDIHVVSLPIDRHEQAFISNSVDGLVTSDPVRSRLIRKGATELFNSRQLPGEVMAVLVVRSDRLNATTPAIKQTINGWFQARDYVTQNPTDALSLMAKRQQVSIETMKASLTNLRLADRDTNERLLLGNKPELVVYLKKLHDSMIDAQLLFSATESSRLVAEAPLIEKSIRVR